MTDGAQHCVYLHLSIYFNDINSQVHYTLFHVIKLTNGKKDTLSVIPVDDKYISEVIRFRRDHIWT